MSEPIFDPDTIEYAEAQTACMFCHRGAVEPTGIQAAGGTQIYWRVRCRLCGRTFIVAHMEDDES